MNGHLQNQCCVVILQNMTLTLLIDCRRKFPLTETALFFRLDFLLMMPLLVVLLSVYGLPYNAVMDTEHYELATVQALVAFLPTALNSPNLKEYASVSMKLCDTDISE